ncbi:hypothetical protein EBB79_22345 (plasmid) [Parasedimentitalea marina]|uniref:Sulfotransferase domain-containing protein n=1 Tax=Parasedimentitalea marina TaxID=2483033 RepID=A0A3T0N9C8_9RHOB|nr:hypothetical protein [Parasedimentitalea marina]AZV80627.1 hypothetical protein EBB79_21930 [Parasedimentitalea marina]AZV80693.1 hypothetical protein EBB79_22345 [Parasedimentitalea marina]
MTQFVLHIGTHKTGSSLLQQFLLKNRDALRAQGIDIPTFAGRSGAKVHTHIANFFRGLDDPCHDEVAALIARGISELPHCLISSENLYWCNTRDMVAGVRAVFPVDTRIICHFRTPASHAVSMWKQLLKGKRKSNSLPDYLATATEELNQGISYYCYDPSMAHWRNFFADTTAALYTPQDNQAFVRAFFETCRLPLQISDTLIYPKAVNVSVSDECSVLMLRLNQMLAAGRLSTETRDRFTAKILKNAPAFSEQVAPHATWETVDLSAFNQAFAKDSPQLAATLPAPEPEIAFPTDLRLSDEEIKRICGSP